MRACDELDHFATSKILENLVKGPYRRRKVGAELENMGMFQAQQLVHIVTLVILMKNKNVTNHIGAVVGTETYEYLMAMDPEISLVFP